MCMQAAGNCNAFLYINTDCYMTAPSKTSKYITFENGIEAIVFTTKTCLAGKGLWPDHTDPKSHSVCFPNRNLGVRGANRSYSESIQCVLEVYWLWMHTERHLVAKKILLCVFKIIFTLVHFERFPFWTLSVCFPNTFRTLSECR